MIFYRMLKSRMFRLRCDSHVYAVLLSSNFRYGNY